LAVSKNYYEKFEEILNEINWNEQLDHLNDVDEICEKFYKVFPKNSERKYSDKIVNIRKNDRSWVNNEIRREIRMRDRLRKQCFEMLILNYIK
jgi:hypothetical protein